MVRRKLFQCRSEDRVARVRRVLSLRQPDLRLVLANIHDPHNVSAILRSCDAFGVMRVHLYYTTEKFPALGHKSSASARKWVETVRHPSAEEMIGSLRAEGLQVLGTAFDETARPLPEWDLTRPTAIIFGNEHRGLDPELAALAPDRVYIPMSGMVQSLNVSVAAAITLYEAWRQRSVAGMFDAPRLEPEALEGLVKDWCEK
ncbi:MAG: RNA methyltransferase [Thermodesulfobacteriota bacterium]